MNFQYSMPTRIVAGNACLAQHGAVLKELGQKPLIVTGVRSAKANGSLDDVVKALEANGQAYAIFDKVMSNPTVQCAYDGAAMATANGCDCFIAIGGGSPMDAAKAMALVAAREAALPPEEIFSASFSRALPVAAIPTTAGTGSEVTQYSILTNDAAETKTSIATPLIFPKMAFLDPAYMRDLGKTVTINTAVDALSHSVEGMLSVRASTISDALAKESIALIASCLEALKRTDVSMAMREKLLQASTLGGMVIANTGTTAVHAMGYSLTYYKNVDHGRANGLLLPQFLGFVAGREPQRVAEILACMKLETVADFERVMVDLLGERKQLSAEEVARYAEKASCAGNIANCLVRPEKADLAAMLNSALR